MKRLGLWFAVAVTVSVAVPAERAAGGQFAFGDTDRVLFFSSTAMWPASYGMQIETFVRVKYPQLKTRFWHWGPSLPVKLPEMKTCIDDYLPVFEPTVVVLNCGLDDGEVKPLVESKLGVFRTDLLAMIEKCEKAGAKVILVTPNCPEKSRKTALIKADYDEVVDRYAQVMRDVAAERKLMVIDWYAATRERLGDSGQGKDKRNALTTDGLHATPLAHAIATDVMLEAFGAEPHEVTVHVDWASLEARTTVGSISATRKDDSAVTVALGEFPMPWAFPRGARLFEPDRPGARFCRFIFHLHNVPPGGVLISEGGGKPTPWLEGMLEEGFDMASVGPLITARPVQELMNEIFKRKNLRLDQLERFLQKPLAEPEYAEVNVMYRKAMVAELEAVDRVMNRTPRTMDVALEIKLAKPPAGK
ncbi:MAG TPA: GDSL-type esterase/lipase family protein [Phycisphaerae bacterium]|nr:GDSL-type esterase/lipase family protein [Phycisphaerae bacterium]